MKMQKMVKDNEYNTNTKRTYSCLKSKKKKKKKKNNYQHTTNVTVNKSTKTTKYMMCDRSK